MTPPPPTSTLFPYTTLFRSQLETTQTEKLIRLETEHEGLVSAESLDEWGRGRILELQAAPLDRKSTRLNSSHQIISYAVFCLKKKKKIRRKNPQNSKRSLEK